MRSGNEVKAEKPHGNKGRKPAPQTIQASIKVRRDNPEWRKLVGQRSRERGAGKDNSYLHTPEIRAKIAATRRGQTEVNRQNGIRALKHWKWREYRDPSGEFHKFRSSYELEFAKGLDEMKLTWCYEPLRLQLSNGKSYTPDFWVEEWKSYVEVKGWIGWGDITKVETAIKDGHPIIVLEGKPKYWVRQLVMYPQT